MVTTAWTFTLDSRKRDEDRYVAKQLDGIIIGTKYTQGAKLYVCWQTDMASYKNVSYVD